MKNFIGTIGIIGAMTIIGAISCNANETKQEAFVSAEETKQEAFVPAEESVELIIFEEPMFIKGRVKHLDFSNEEPMIIIVNLKEDK